MKFSDIDIHKIGTSLTLNGVIFEGEGTTFLMFLPKEQEKTTRTERLDMDLEEWRKFLHQTDVVEVPVDVEDETGKISKAILRKNNRQIDSVIQWKVFKRDGYRCRYCGSNDTPLTVDHLICWENGGPTIERNLLASCRKCNKARGNISFREWLQHPRYVDLSRRLSPDVRKANEDLVHTLLSIPLVYNKKSR